METTATLAARPHKRKRSEQHNHCYKGDCHRSGRSVCGDSSRNDRHEKCQKKERNGVAAPSFPARRVPE